jgi:uroporphyrinogen-III synthase
LKIKKILVSQPEPNNPKSPYFDLAKKYNLKVEFKPFVQVEGVSSKDFRQQKINIHKQNRDRSFFQDLQ